MVWTCGKRQASEKPTKKRRIPSSMTLKTKAVKKNKIEAPIKPAMMILWVPILSPKAPNREAAKNVAIPGKAAITPEIKTTPPWPFINCRTYSDTIGLIELVAA